MEKVDLFVIISTICLFFSILSIIIVLITAIKVVAMEKATHTITFQPVDEEIEKANQKTMEQWSRQSQTQIENDQKEFKEDLEDEFPEFLTDEDEEDDVISF